MFWLIVVSLLWAPSPGLIRHWLPGVDPGFVSCVRVALSLLVFAPLLRVRGLSMSSMLTLAAIGAVQFGLMYVCYIAALQVLPAYAVAILTIFTPVFVCLCEDLLARRWHGWPWVAAALATLGAAVIFARRPPDASAWKGILLLQLSNVCFAFGQVAYRRWRRARPEIVDARVFGLLYAGAVTVTLPLALPAWETALHLGARQWLVLAFLGAVASGLGFFLWNHGATRTAPGPLAVANNLKIPLMVLASLTLFREPADLGRLATGGALIIAAGLLAEWAARRAAP